MEDTESLKNQQQTTTEQTPDADDPLSKGSEKTQIFRNKFYQNVSDSSWNDWRWQIRNSIITYDELVRIFGSSDYELSEDINLPLRITPYYASTITSLSSGIGKCVIPTKNELFTAIDENQDFLEEENFSPLPNIVHRYPDRILFLTTDFCSSNCRYCTRSRLVNRETIAKKEWDKGIEYIRNHKEIRDVLLSGGDIFTMEDDKIEYLLKNIRSIEHVEFLRIGTKVPVVLPQRITKKLTKMLSKYHPLFLSIHFTHPDELTPEVKEVCERLANAGIPLGSQTVLLKGVNDNIDTIKKLMHELLKIRVKPYYLYQCDKVVGTFHFRTTIEKGLEIIRMLQGHTSGYAIPRFIIDSHLGKIEVSPNNIVSYENGVYKLTSFTNEILTYEE